MGNFQYVHSGLEVLAEAVDFPNKNFTQAAANECTIAWSSRASFQIIYIGIGSTASSNFNNLIRDITAARDQNSPPGNWYLVFPGRL